MIPDSYMNYKRLIDLNKAVPDSSGSMGPVPKRS